MSEAFEHYFRDGSHRGEPLPGSHSGSAGGAICGDVIELSLRIEAGRLRDVRVATEGCGSASAAGACAAELLDGATLSEAALLAAAEIDAELGGLSPVGRHAADLAADALHRALGTAVMSGEPLLAAPDVAGGEPERVLVAMSGGVDSAVAAHLEQRGGAEVLAVTLELWSDPANDGDASCCSRRLCGWPGRWPTISGSHT